MKLQSEQFDVKTGGIKESQQFTIEASPKAFLILSNSLYSNKIKAVVRELSTNAYDSHIAAGTKDRPFDVHLPNVKEPFFSIRDYGVSLTHDECMNLYQTYFKSTKNDTNDAVGCLGLGSKSPFAYTDSFIVKAYLDGSVRIYTAYISSDGVPNFDLMSEEKTTEENGLLVQVPVKQVDMSEFLKEAEYIYRFFDVKPNICGQLIQFPKVVVDFDTWSLIEDSQNYVLMGQVAYPINTNRFDSDIINFLYGTKGFVLKVNIGDIDITPSRESISYNKTTINNITNCFNTIFSNMNKYTDAIIDNCESVFEARKAYIELNKVLKSGTKTTWKGQKLFDRGGLIDVSNPILCFEGSSYRKPRFKEVNEISFLKSRFVFNDTNKPCIGKVCKYFRDNPLGYSVKVYVYKGKLEDYLKLLGDAKESDIIKASTLPSNTIHRHGNSSVRCLTYNEDDQVLEETNFSVKYKNAMYLAMSNNCISIKGYNYSKSNLASLFKVLQSNGIDCGNFYIVLPSIISNSKLENRNNWSNGLDFLIESIKSILEENKITSLLEYRSLPTRIESDDYIEGLYQEAVEYNKKRKSTIAKIDKIFKNCEILDIIKATKVIDYDCSAKDFEELCSKYIKIEYPLYNHCNYSTERHMYVQDMQELKSLRKQVSELCNTL